MSPEDEIRTLCAQFLTTKGAEFESTANDLGATTRRYLEEHRNTEQQGPHEIHTKATRVA